MGRHGAAPWAGHGKARLGSPMALGHAVPRHVATKAGWDCRRRRRGRRSAKGADRPLDQAREAHHSARPLHSPRGPDRSWQYAHAATVTQLRG